MIIASLVTFLERSSVRHILAGIPRIGSVLDVPCGSGKLWKTIPSGSSVVGVDASWQQLRLYRAGAPHPAVRGDVRHLPLKDSSVDLVLCHRLLHRLPPDTRDTCLFELRRVSKGWSLIYYSIDSWLVRGIEILERLAKMGDRGLQYRCSIAEARNEIRRVFGEVVREKPILRGLSSGRLFLVREV
jgi:SAM-dependent methyltransferase